MQPKSRTWRERLHEIGALGWVNFGIFAAALALFAFIAHEVADGDHLPREQAIMAHLRTGTPVRPIGPVWVAQAARDITGLGSSVVLTGLTVLAVGFLAFSRKFGAALFLALAAGGGQALNAALKSYYGRMRPDADFRWVPIDSPSFPSGHATSSAVIYLTLAVLLIRLTPERTQKAYLIGSALALSFFVGASRVYLGVHYPTDVVAGWCIGVAWAEVCWFAAHLLGRRRLAKTTAPATSS
jgi:undecaprenyl-diphosphatase